ncbi:MAG: ABC transporter ATP-binding protein [Rhizobiaceae bacterium]|nr:ABC transporter ATP-binding protein [Rhizobiaceae bacterium]
MGLVKMLSRILEPLQRAKALGLLLLMLIGMGLETLGVGLVLPAIALMTSSDMATAYPAIQPLLSALGNPTREMLIVMGMAAMAAVYALKALFLIYLAWVQAGFLFQLHASLSQRLLTSYLRQPYAFHLRRNSAELIRNVTTEVNLFTNAAQATLMLLTELLVILGIVALLFFVEPLGALAVGFVLGLAAMAFYRVFRSRILTWGKKRQHHEGLRIQHVQQGLGGAKDVKLLGREADFLDQYRMHNQANAAMLQRQYFMQLLPRLFLEVLAVCSLAGLVAIMAMQGKSLDQILPILGVFGAAAFRLLPSVNRSMTSLQATRFALPVIQTLHKELTGIDSAFPLPNAVPIRFESEIRLDNVTMYYEGSDRAAVENVSIVIPKGASVGFIGDSGGGKSTLIDVLLGLLTPSGGRVLVDGCDISDNLRGWQSHIGYVPQAIFLTDDTIRRNIAFGIADADIDDEAVASAMYSARLDEFVASLPEGLNTVVGERGVRLSGGQRQRIGIARALYHDPDVLVLDEATSSLDNATEKRIMDTVDAVRGKKTIIMVAHRLSTVENCDHLFRVTAGRVAATGPDMTNEAEKDTATND